MCVIIGSIDLSYNAFLEINNDYSLLNDMTCSLRERCVILA